MGKASYIARLRTHTHIFFFMFAIGKVHISFPKKPPSRKYAKSKYHQSLLHATEPQATTALEHLSYF